MKHSLEPIALSEGEALLSRLPETFSNILQTARLEHKSGGKVLCSIEIPGIGQRTTSAESPYEAIRLAILELTYTLTISDSQSQIPKINSISSDGKASVMTHESPERFQSKARQHTIGVTLPMRLKSHLNSLAEIQSTSFAEISRRFAVFGFEDFVDRSLYASPVKLFDLLAREFHEWQDSNAEQVMLRLEPGHAIRIRSAAKEYEKSASELAALSIAHGLVMQELFVSLENKIARSQGAAIRPLLPKLELPSFATPLISGVLAGNIRAPKILLRRLANVFETPESLLSTFFRRSFDQRLVPAFKAENGKPELHTAATSWTVAVKSLNLSPEQAKALLDLGV